MKIKIKRVFVILVLVPLFTATIAKGAEDELTKLGRFVNSLPVFVSLAGIQAAADGVLTVGVFSDKEAVDGAVLKLFEELKIWNSGTVMQAIGHKKISVVALDKNNLATFSGQIIWVLEGNSSLEQLKKITEKGIFTAGVQDEKFSDYLFVTLIYENKSDDPDVERWRLSKLIANCEISPLKFSKKMKNKDYFVGKGCE